jgi:hypothetical protein
VCGLSTSGQVARVRVAEAGARVVVDRRESGRVVRSRWPRDLATRHRTQEFRVSPKTPQLVRR